MPDLKITIGADVNGLLTGMQQAGKSLQDFEDQAKRFKAALATATDPAVILRLNKAIEASGLAMNKIKTAGTAAGSAFDKVARSGNSATQSLTNMGRVAQDLPFGFLGIQNNLNPLLEGFQRLRAETGSNKAAFKALGSSLMGAGGLGLALSLVSGAILIYQNGIAGFNTKTKEAKDEVKEYAKSLREAELSGISAGLQLQNFANIARDTTQSLTTRNEALLQANKILGDHGEKLTLVNIATTAATEEINKFTEATIQQALAAKFSDRAADLIIKQREAIKTYTVALAAERKVRNLPVNALDEFGQVNAATISAVARSTKDAADAYKVVTAELGNMKTSLSDAQGSAAKLFGELGHHKKVDSTKTIETISSVLAKLGRQINELNQEQLTFGIDKSPEKISAIESAIKTLVARFSVDPKGTIIQKLFGDINDLSKLKVIRFDAEDLTKLFFDEAGVKMVVPAFVELDFKKNLAPHLELKDVLPTENFEQLALKAKLVGMGITKGLQGGLMVGIEGLRFPELKALAESAAKELEDFNATMTSILQNTVGDIFVQLGESIGGGENLFAGFLKVLGSGLKTLGAEMIKLAPIIKTIKTAMKSLNPALLLVGGIALVAIGTLLSKAKIPGFAGGVTNFGGGLAMVGERGPELVRLPQGSDVIPNNRLSGISGGTQVFIPDVRLRGSDMVIAFSRASQTISRNG